MELEAKRALATIHASMNTFQKINRLPPEVLALIPSFLTSHKDLVFTTHVCNHWRNTITASPPLWSSLDNETMDENLVATYMDRCGGTPLDVSFSSVLSKDLQLLVKLVPHSSHIRTICIPCVPWCHIAEISDAFDTPLPLLRDVELSVSENSSPPRFQRPFLAGATNLVSLDLTDDSPLSGTLLHFIIPTLTRLRISFCDPRIPTVGEILELLRTSPLIEDLDIHADIVLDTTEENSGLPDRFEQVDLPCLRDVHLCWITPRSQYTLLAHIQHPPDCSISTQVRSDSDVAQPPQNVFPKSWDVFSLADTSKITLRMKREESKTECTVTVKKSNGSSASVSHVQDVRDFISTDGDDNPVRDPRRDRDDNHVLSDAITLIRKLPLRCIRNFTLEDLKADEMSKSESFEIPPALVSLITSDMRNLTSLSLARTCVSELLEMLTPPPLPPPTYLAGLFDSDTALEPNALPCPALKVLKMRQTSWVASRHCPELLALAKARKYEGIPFDRVLLCSSSAPKSMTTGLSLYADDIEICSECE